VQSSFQTNLLVQTRQLVVDETPNYFIMQEKREESGGIVNVFSCNTKKLIEN